MFLMRNIIVILIFGIIIFGCGKSTEIKIVLVGKCPLCKNDCKKVDGLDKIYLKNMNVLIK